MDERSTARLFLPILAVLYVLGFTNLFLRSSFGVMAPHLAGEMHLSPAALSAVASAFFFAYAAMQVPTGVLLDRFGARRTLATMLLFTMVGAAVFSVAESGGMLAFGRVLMGIGCAGVFTGAFYVLALWLPPSRVVVSSGSLNSFAALGNLAATTPLAALIAWIGWRESYWIFTAGVLLLLTSVAVLVRDAPPAAPPRSSNRESLTEVIAGVRAAVRQPGIARLLVAGFPMSAGSVITGVWGAPYLRDVHGLDDLGRGNVLLAMALSAIAGHLLCSRLARWLNSLRRAIVAGASGLVVTMGLMAIVAGPPLWLVVALFCCTSLFGSYPTVTMAHARGLVPANLMGRGVSVTNMGTMTAIALMQFVFGWIVGFFPSEAGASPESAYRTAFAVQAVVAVVALLIYAPVPDVRPKG
jgi:MFS family permease